MGSSVERGECPEGWQSHLLSGWPTELWQPTPEGLPETKFPGMIKRFFWVIVNVNVCLGGTQVTFFIFHKCEKMLNTFF